jgi:hypothetical protein
MSEEEIDETDGTSNLKTVAEKLAREDAVSRQKGDINFRRWLNFES